MLYWFYFAFSDNTLFFGIYFLIGFLDVLLLEVFFFFLLLVCVSRIDLANSCDAGNNVGVVGAGRQASDHLTTCPSLESSGVFCIQTQ